MSYVSALEQSSDKPIYWPLCRSLKTRSFFRDNKTIGLLNGNEKANYAVYIGDKKVPAIIHKHKNTKPARIRGGPIQL